MLNYCLKFLKTSASVFIRTLEITLRYLLSCLGRYRWWLFTFSSLETKLSTSAVGWTEWCDFNPVIKIWTNNDPELLTHSSTLSHCEVIMTLCLDLTNTPQLNRMSLSSDEELQQGFDLFLIKSDLCLLFPACHSKFLTAQRYTLPTFFFRSADHRDLPLLLLWLAPILRFSSFLLTLAIYTPFKTYNKL